ncbi:UBAP1-MVB12-associated (UMA)-domain containing protein 1 isoform X3 [Chrysemys picta bellii]|uniref:UBAP1-MVB12-associated (UMA)-domain containing protein 1 isoform X3 n=1 Tax=Chrysemys picta bellii TaxID=8478 RepID=UPI0032B21639
MRGRGPSCMTPMWNSPEARAADALSVTGHRAPSSGGKPAFPLSDESSSRPGNRGGIGAGLPLRPPIERDKIRYRRPGDVVKRRFLLRRKRGALGVSMLGLSGDRPRKRRRQWQRQEVSWFGSGERLRRVRIRERLGGKEDMFNFFRKTQDSKKVSLPEREADGFVLLDLAWWFKWLDLLPLHTSLACTTTPGRYTEEAQMNKDSRAAKIMCSGCHVNSLLEVTTPLSLLNQDSEKFGKRMYRIASNSYASVHQSVLKAM